MSTSLVSVFPQCDKEPDIDCNHMLPEMLYIYVAVRS